MITAVSKIYRYYRRHGVVGLGKGVIAKWYSQYLRSLSKPDGYFSYNGIEVGVERRRIDRLITPQGWRYSDKPEYKESNIKLLEKYTRRGDAVVILGGGHGVTAVKAAKCTGENGSVEVMEASDRRIKTLRKTIELNDVDNICNVHHTLVGPAIDISGFLSTATPLDPRELPECDLIECDCEGAEAGILEKMEISPRVIIVESHPENGAPTNRVTGILEGRGYRINTISSDRSSGDVIAGIRDSCA